MTESSKAMSDIRGKASYWLVQLSSDDVTADDYRQFNTWLAADPLHEEIYREAETLFNDFTELKYLGEERPLVANPVPDSDKQQAGLEETAPLPPSKPIRRFAAAVPAIAVSIILAVMVGWTLLPVGPSVSAQRYETTVAEIRSVDLPDGSIVTLSGKTVIDVTIDNRQRSVVLRTGQAFFEVAPDATHPFTVTAGETFVYVVGTKFDVRLGPEAVDIGVLEGEVRVSMVSNAGGVALENDSADDTYVLTAGQKIAGQLSGDLTPVKAVTLDKPGAWRDGILIYENAKLLDLVADVNRYYSGGIEFAGDDIADLRVTAVFRPSQVEQMLQTLTRAYPIEVRRDGSGRIVLGSVVNQQ